MLGRSENWFITEYKLSLKLHFNIDNNKQHFWYQRSNRIVDNLSATAHDSLWLR